MPHRDYIIGGIKYPSVTEILAVTPKPWLEDWCLKWGVLADRKTAAATKIGRDFHKCIEDRTNIAVSKRVSDMYNSFSKWAVDNRLLILTQEIHVVSDKYKYHGTFDAVGTLGKSKKLILFDWKTSSGIYEDMGLQLSAYAQAYKEHTGTEIKKGMIVLVSKDKPHHKVLTQQYSLNSRLLGKFLRKLEYYNRVHNG